MPAGPGDTADSQAATPRRLRCTRLLRPVLALPVEVLRRELDFGHVEAFFQREQEVGTGGGRQGDALSFAAVIVFRVD